MGIDYFRPAQGWMLMDANDANAIGSTRTLFGTNGLSQADFAGGFRVSNNGGDPISVWPTLTNLNVAATSQVALARLSGITSNQMAATETAILNAAVTNGQSGVTLTGTLTPTNSLTVTNSLQLAGIAALWFPTNAVGTSVTNLSFWTGTAAAYAALPVTNATTLYFTY
jgi:hypothetical protein